MALLCLCSRFHVRVCNCLLPGEQGMCFRCTCGTTVGGRREAEWHVSIHVWTTAWCLCLSFRFREHSGDRHSYVSLPYTLLYCLCYVFVFANAAATVDRMSVCRTLFLY